MTLCVAVGSLQLEDPRQIPQPHTGIRHFRDIAVQWVFGRSLFGQFPAPDKLGPVPLLLPPAPKFGLTHQE
jgi:hypothetical protein